jgi:hypothetical protein
MDPITTAIVAVLTAGINKVGQQALVDSYNGLKNLLKKKFGDQSEAVKAVESLEVRPDSKSRQGTLQEEILAAKADQDQDLVRAAQDLLKQVNAQPGGSQIVQTITGNYNAQNSGSGSASVHVNAPDK